MFTAYLYKTTDIENACKQFLSDNFKETCIEDVIDSLDCTEFVKECLLKKEYLDGEIVEEDDHVGILTTKALDSFNINDVCPNKTYPLQNKKVL